MFTGLIEAKGEIVGVVDQPPGKRFSVDAAAVAQGVSLGDSVAINGCCLTVVAFDGPVLEFEAGDETLACTNLGRLGVGGSVNLERALAVGDRLGGHYVTGHVDAPGALVERAEDPPWANLRFSMPPRLASQVAAKGSITIDGVSLTVVAAGADWFSVALIPHTLSMTTLGDLSVGDPVNLETDVLAKYVERSLTYAQSAATDGAEHPGGEDHSPSD